MPIVSPPTPAPSPRPISSVLSTASADVAHASRLEFSSLKSSGPTARQQYLAALLADCSPAELLFVSNTIAPLLKRDFLRDLPIELSLHILDYIDDARTLARASRVSRFWNSLMRDEATWRRMCVQAQFEGRLYPKSEAKASSSDSSPSTSSSSSSVPLLDGRAQAVLRELPPEMPHSFSHRDHFIYCYKTMTNWRNRGRLLNKHRPPSATPDGGVVTSIALDHEWIVVGLASCRIQVFSARSGVLSRTLVGHELGVWAVNLVSAGGHWVDPPLSAVQPRSKQVPGDPPAVAVAESTDVGSHVWLSEARSKFGGSASSSSMDLGEMEFLIPDSLRTAIGLDKPRSARRTAGSEPPKPSDICCASEGWGNANALVVSGGCDKQLRVWDVKSGYCIYVLEGHTSTIRCLRVLHNRPIAISGSRDTTLRVWDVQRGKLLRTLTGHDESVRCLDVCGNQAVSGSYDATCRLWNIDTGECLHVLRGHLHQIYSVAYDCKYIASGGLDTTVRVWNPVDGQCLALLQGHTALVCQLQLTGSTLATGGSDGRVIAFTLPSSPNESWQSTNSARRIAAHDSSVTALQLDAHWLVTGGNDGRVRLYDAQSGTYVRDLTSPAEAVWKVAHKYDKCVVMCKRAGKTVMEIWSFRPSEDDD
ncbi:WD40 repeat-like protein [Fomitiporia mediterranea MF3/22]|uniref:WD40 repeat-like protein n=1 Tax=Fomitiporia mediterranea (strain MF3/22) TaxID=694068 RepID=UPI0004408981|nr:WD40 repeat-like protein [Fomitiporia mediterranea MF3/22]EJD00002.1 WD40 repeat-like protein [Fomitiporia mediterranea MF3/22]